MDNINVPELFLEDRVNALFRYLKGKDRRKRDPRWHPLRMEWLRELRETERIYNDPIRAINSANNRVLAVIGYKREYADLAQRLEDISVKAIKLADHVAKVITFSDKRGIADRPVMFLYFGQNLVEEEEKPKGDPQLSKYGYFAYEFGDVGEVLPMAGDKLQIDASRPSQYHDYRYSGHKLDLLRGMPLSEFMAKLGSLDFLKDCAVVIQDLHKDNMYPNNEDYRMNFYYEGKNYFVNVKLRRDGILFVPHSSIIKGTEAKVTKSAFEAVTSMFPHLLPVYAMEKIKS